MPEARKPVCSVLLNYTGAMALGIKFPVMGLANVELRGVIEAEVVNNNYYSADTFRVVVALSQEQPWFDIDFICSLPAIPLKISMGSGADDTQTLIEGLVDDFDYDPAANTVELQGRDYTRFFIDNTTDETWVMASVSDVVTTLAAQYGLTVVLGSSPILSARVGAYMAQLQTRLGNGSTEWDLLTALAGQLVDSDGNSFVTYVSGSSLYFGPRPSSPTYFLDCVLKRDGRRFCVLPAKDPSAGPPWGATSLRFSRNLSTLRNPVVEMCSAQFGADTLTESFSRDDGATADTAPLQSMYRFKMPPNIPADALARMAQARQQDISRQEVRLSLSLPGDSVLTQDCLLQVSGLGTALSQNYFVRSVTRRFTASGGYVMECSAQNQAAPAGEGDS